MKDDLEKFEAWIIDMPDALERFASELPESISGRLDYSPAATEVLEGWLLSSFASIEQYKRESTTTVFDGCARYIGETFRRNLGGEWELCTRERSPYYLRPVLIGAGTKAETCPHSLVTASLDRRTGRFIRLVLERK
jgi:hypothetical protein